MKRIVSLFLVIAIISTLAACADSSTSKTSSVDTTAAAVTEGETSDTRFDNIDYEGRDFRVQSSEDASDSTNANALIAGSGEMNGEIVNDAVYKRNLDIEEKLKVKLVYTPSDYTYDTASTEIRKLVLAGDDVYDLIINDLRSVAELSAEGLFKNVYNSDVIDLTRSYWYSDYMNDLMVVKGGMYVLAGDYFMDVLASCHVLYYNKDIIKDSYGDGDTIYNYVFDGTWTLDKFIEMVTATARDLDGDSKMKEGDLFGFTCIGTWGSAVPVLEGTGIQFVTRDNGNIEFCFNNERSVTILEKMNELFYSAGTLTAIKDNNTAGLRTLFASGNTVFLGYNRLGDLANMREIEFGIGVVPYPKLDTDQKAYVTSTHDTTEVGGIPTTITDLEFVTTVIEALSADTAVTVLPEYYENSLKVKYASDNTVAKMIDIIHDSISSPFALAYDSAIGSFMMSGCFCTPLTSKKTDFASFYAKGEAKAVEKMAELVANFTKILNTTTTDNTAAS
jgi:ABC-type sugar transport system, periplasmic component